MADKPAVAGPERLYAAIRYAEKQNFRIIPDHTIVDGCCTCGNKNCDRPGKHPMTKNGVKDATDDLVVITNWWAEMGNLPNVGIATGVVSNLVVLDIDVKSGGMETLALWKQEHGEMPKTPTVRTPTGGLHFYFKYPEGVSVGSKTGIAPGFDIRGDGGQVVAPPSIHANGRPYGWIEPETTPRAEMPAPLLDLIRNPKPKGKPKSDPPAAGPSNPMVMTLAAAALDLRTSPGAGEGNRHDTLCKLAGVQLARGEDAKTVEADALKWAETCEPPMDAAQVIRTVKSLAAKHAGTATAQVVITPTMPATATDDVEAVALPDAPPWPVLHEDALYGWSGEFIRAVAPHTEADPVGVLSSTFVAVGNCVGRNARFLVEGDYHHVNFFVADAGESSRGRKGTSLSRTMSMLKDIDPEWYAHRVVSGLSSGEGLIWQVRDPITVMESVKEKGAVRKYEEVVKDPGVEDKRLFVTETEFAQVLRVLRREGNTLSALIRQAWDRGNLSSLTKNSPAKATDAHVSVLAHVTLTELRKYLDDTDVFNGFANRFLWCLVRRQQLLPFGGDSVDLTAIRDRLAEIVTKAKTVTTMTRTPAARALWSEVYPELTAERPGLYGAVTGRAEAQTLRLSMLYALLDGQSVIDVPHLKAALAFWRYCDESAKIIFGKAEAEGGDALEQELVKLIRQTPGINRRGLHQALGGHMTGNTLVSALAKIRDRGQVRCERVATGGRPGECWFPCDPTVKA